MKYYQVTITYPCDICGARHLSKKGSDIKIGEQEKDDLRVEGFNALRDDFKIKHPEDTLKIERVVIEEVNQLGQVQNLPIKSMGGKYIAAIDITNQKGKKKAEEVESEPIKTAEGMSFEEIQNKVKVRIAELIKANKNCQEAMDKLRIQFTENKDEIVSLQSLLHATNQGISQYTKDKGKKKNGRKKRKQKPKGK